MRFSFIASITALFFGILAPVNAATQVTETWEVDWDGGSCIFVFNYDKAEMAGPVRVQKPCGGLLRKVKSFVYTDSKRRELILFNRKNARGDPVAIFEKSGRNEMDGYAGDGEPVSMFNTSSSTMSVNSGLSSQGSASSGSADCIVYADSGSCVNSADRKNPKIPTFKKINMRALAGQSIYPFSGGKGFAKDESADGGACYEVKKCERAFNSSEDWCEIVLSDGFFTGWVKRMDDEQVYLRKGC